MSLAYASSPVSLLSHQDKQLLEAGLFSLVVISSLPWPWEIGNFPPQYIEGKAEAQRD